MLVRVASTLIVVFWLGTTGWLLKTLYFSEEDRFEPIAVEEAIGTFFRSNDTTNLTVLENGVKIGQMVVGGLEGVDPRTRKMTRGLTSSGTLDEPESSALNGFTWRLNANFSDSNEPKDLEATLRLPQQDLNLHFELNGDPPQVGARVTIGEATIFETGELSADDLGEALSGKGNGMSSRSANPIPMLLPGLSSPAGKSILADANSMMPKLEASKGFLEVAGRPLPVFLLKIRFGDGTMGEPIRLYLSEAGEPLRIDTGWGFEAVAEVLIPVEISEADARRP